MRYRTIIISDLHLGTKDSKYNSLYQFLETNTCEHLILNGDIIDGRHLKFFGGRKTKYTKFLQNIITLAKKNGTAIHYIIGNHDGFLKKSIPTYLQGIRFFDHIIWASGTKKYYITHGDKFFYKMSTLNWYSFCLFIIHTIFLRIDRNTNHNYIISKFLKSLFKKIFKLDNNRKNKVSAYAKNHGYGGIIIGHTHKAKDVMINGVHYLNSGDSGKEQTVICESLDNTRKIIHYGDKK